MKKFLVVDEDSHGQGDTLEDAFDDLKNKVSYTLVFEDLIFYEAVKINVKQKLVIENGND